MTCARKPYPSDVSDEERSLVVPYLTLMIETAPQRGHSLRARRQSGWFGAAIRMVDAGCGRREGVARP